MKKSEKPIQWIHIIQALFPMNVLQGKECQSLKTCLKRTNLQQKQFAQSIESREKVRKEKRQ